MGTDLTENVKNIVIVDDDKDLQGLFAAVNPKGLNITIFNSEYDALEYLQDVDGAVDGVLIDLSMPVIDGITIAEEIRLNEKMHIAKKNKKPVRLAFFTSWRMEQTIRDAMVESNVERVFRKPCDPFELMEQVTEWIN